MAPYSQRLMRLVMVAQHGSWHYIHLLWILWATVLAYHFELYVYCDTFFHGFTPAHIWDIGGVEQTWSP
jgi:hypothetical protein